MVLDTDKFVTVKFLYALKKIKCPPSGSSYYFFEDLMQYYTHEKIDKVLWELIVFEESESNGTYKYYLCRLCPHKDYLDNRYSESEIVSHIDKVHNIVLSNLFNAKSVEEVIIEEEELMCSCGARYTYDKNIKATLCILCQSVLVFYPKNLKMFGKEM